MRALLILLLLAAPALAQDAGTTDMALALASGDRKRVQQVLRQHPEAARARVGDAERSVAMTAYALGLRCEIGVLKDLLDAGGEVRSQDPRVGMPLPVAVTTANVEAVKMLLQRGADPNALVKGIAPIHLAVTLALTPMADQALPVTQALLEGGANPNLPFPRDSAGRAATPLQYATAANLAEMAKLLRRFGAQ